MAAKPIERHVLGGTFKLVKSPTKVWADIWLSDFGDQLRVPKSFQCSIALGRPSRAAIQWSRARHKEACERWANGRDPIRQKVR